METHELCRRLKISQDKIERFSYVTQACRRSEINKPILIPVLRQIAINLHVIYRNFDKMPISEVDQLVRKSGVMCYMGDMYTKTTNRDKKSEYIDRNMRPQAKSKLLYIHNHLLRYVNSATA